MWNAETWVLLLWLIANVPVYLLIGWMFFGSWQGFFEAWDEQTRTPPNWPRVQLLMFGLWVVGILGAEYHFLHGFLFRCANLFR
jgi:hypothetical protein